jgi:hypothetical protein
MGQQAVSFVINVILTDRHLRDRFAVSPMEVLVDLHLAADIELTRDEIEALVLAGPAIWRQTGNLTHIRIH